ncbi:MAG TPA: hypothetical protein VIM77_05725 [Mucilaginibacter sp.]
MKFTSRFRVSAAFAIKRTGAAYQSCDKAMSVFAKFSAAPGTFLHQFVGLLHPDVLVICGHIASSLFLPDLKNKISVKMIELMQ